MLKRWAIYRSEGGGMLTLLGVILAVDADSALDKAERLLPEERSSACDVPRSLEWD